MTQKISKVLILFLVVTGLFSCNDDDNTTAFDGIGDIYTLKKIINDEVQYANAYFAYGNQGMSMATVTTPEGSEIVLSAANSLGNTWAKTAEASDFSTELPTDGLYTFNVLNEDIPHEFTDELTFLDLEFVTIISTSTDNSVITVEWENGSDSEGTLVQLINEEGNIVFGSQLLTNTVTEFQIDSNTASGTWTEGYPNNGDTYTLQVQSFAFDNDATNMDYSFHIEEIAIREELVTWQ